MLTALEDLLDTWPGTLIVVSHDRYLLERVTDTQFALIDGELSHLPGGVDQYVDILRREKPAPAASSRSEESVTTNAAESLRPGSSEHRQLQKAHQALGRKISDLEKKRLSLVTDMEACDPVDHVALAPLGEQLAALDTELEEAEMTWLEWAEKLDD
jgi:ATPase subunit of ABC transporter with duplicated ATPase domains